MALSADCKSLGHCTANDLFISIKVYRKKNAVNIFVTNSQTCFLTGYKLFCDFTANGQPNRDTLLYALTKS